MKAFWFTYSPYDEHDLLARVLGRDLSGTPAKLEGYRRVEQGAYTYVLPSPSDHVEGKLIEMRMGDDWLLDDEFAVALGYYWRQELEIESEGERRPAWVMVGGPALASIEAEPPGTHVELPPEGEAAQLDMEEEVEST